MTDVTALTEKSLAAIGRARDHAAAPKESFAVALLFGPFNSARYLATTRTAPRPEDEYKGNHYPGGTKLVPKTWGDEQKKGGSGQMKMN